MNVENKIICQKITSAHHALSSVIKDSIGSPTPEKITGVLKSYTLPNHFLIAAFLSKTLIGVVGYIYQDKQATINHLSVLENYRNQGVGKALIQALVRDCAPHKILLETDDQSVFFYKKLGFICEPITGKYNDRYYCYLERYQ